MILASIRFIRLMIAAVLVTAVVFAVIGECQAAGEAAAVKAVAPQAVKWGPRLAELMKYVAAFFPSIGGLAACVGFGFYARYQPEQMKNVCVLPSAAGGVWQGHQWFDWPLVFVKGGWLTKDRYEFSMGNTVALGVCALLGLGIAAAIAHAGKLSGDEISGR